MNEKQEIFFSVIIPLYNKEKYIKRCVNSILNQNYTNFELLIINDNSTDKSLENAKKINDSRIKIIERKQRGHGGYAARNVGIKNAKYNYVSFIDADDEWNPDYLKTIQKLIKQFPKCNVFSTAWSEKDGNIIKTNAFFNSNKTKKNHIVANFYEESSLGRNPIHTNTITTKKNTLIEIGGFPEGKCKRGGDTETWLRLMLKNKLAWSPYIGAIYYKDVPETVTKKISDIEIPYVYYSVKEILKTETNKQVGLKKYSNYHAKMAILHAIVYNKNKKEIIKGFYKEVDKTYYIFFKILIIFPSFILLPLYKIYRKLVIKFSKSDLG